MADDKTKKYLDRYWIDRNDPDEVRYRCKTWNCTEEELFAAMDATNSTHAETVHQQIIVNQASKRMAERVAQRVMVGR